jgi:hypothetical protein
MFDKDKIAYYAEKLSKFLDKPEGDGYAQW